ncbi:GTP cyclohydrolase 1 type 2 [Paraconexibacter sp. AEG42_29]|uniref:GTP cyclohydrolase 1 type 2 homolog n=1 Tax=Paraconexibacter sp. AEG42_29 TaxID=2997339 RepID=A0AAU7AS81_9ACTN
MPPIDTLINTLDGLLKPGGYRDYCPNGLQVPGPEHVTRVITGVSAHAELFEAAAQRGADLVLVHHGLFWNSGPRALDRVAVRRLRLLFDHDIALAAYHLPLDGHQEHGNNALLAAALGAESWVPFAEYKGSPIGVAATFSGDGISRAELVDRVRTATAGREPLAFLDGPDPVRRIGIVSGAAADHIHDALDAGLDAFLTGEPSERIMAVARDYGITFIAAGHHATERFGVRRLGELLAERHGVEHEFVDVPNPI